MSNVDPILNLPASHPPIDITNVVSATVRRIPEHLAYEYGAVAVDVGASFITVAFGSPPTRTAIARLERATGLRVVPVCASDDAIATHLARVFGHVELPSSEVRATQNDAPAVRAVDALQRRAFVERCSDIHLEPLRDGARVRFRIDGLLREVERFSDPLASSLVSRVKILAGMDIAERRHPQDGRYTFAVGSHEIDARVSSVPARDGEKLVIRLLDHRSRIPTFEELGMLPTLESSFRAVIELPYGFVVVCGPTGSGKTTTLYAALSHLNTVDRNICTVEDPIEQTLAGVTQVQVNTRAGVSFDSVLRALLRQDPNIIMVGEMRDCETATTAIGAALSGQLVFTTLHSNDAPRTVERLVELGIARLSMAAGLSAVLAQRLVRRLCRQCRRGTVISEETSEEFRIEVDQLQFEPVGCERCNGSGYFGRVGIFELIILDDEMRANISAGASSSALSALARARGYRTMAEDCLLKCREGVTSFGELARVAGNRVGT